MEKPLVSIIALCYNHAPFVLASLNSVICQDYPHIQLIIVDDASTDQSVSIIQQFIREKCPSAQSIFLEKNKGNCFAFNQGFQLAKGNYIVDLATDDLFLKDRIRKQVLFFEKQAQKVGVIFSDVYLINEIGKILGNFYKNKNPQTIPQGNVYKQLLQPTFICSPSQMIRREVLEELGGYDQNLSYEDFDFWVRSSRKWEYAFQNEILTKKRLLENSHGQTFYKKNNPHLASTLQVCQKAFAQNQHESENKALAVSVRYHLKLSFLTENFEIAHQFTDLLKKIDELTYQDRFWIFLIKNKISVSKLYQLYRKL